MWHAWERTKKRFDGKAQRKETTRKTKVYVGGIIIDLREISWGGGGFVFDWRRIETGGKLLSMR
jgi:hypothetical protein